MATVGLMLLYRYQIREALLEKVLLGQHSDPLPGREECEACQMSVLSYIHFCNLLLNAPRHDLSHCCANPSGRRRGFDWDWNFHGLSQTSLLPLLNPFLASCSSSKHNVAMHPADLNEPPVGRFLVPRQKLRPDNERHPDSQGELKGKLAFHRVLSG
jgi:hypothetical protein